MACSSQIETIFNNTFLSKYNTRLMGGASEPLYRPARSEKEHHRIYYRQDYVSSALHESAHWCIAGDKRRSLLDYGYWYSPDGRSHEQQIEFERVEVKPQALEWLFSNACHISFRLSADNLELQVPPSDAFRRRVIEQARAYCSGALPARALNLLNALIDVFSTKPLDPELYCAGLLKY